MLYCHLCTTQMQEIYYSHFIKYKLDLMFVNNCQEFAQKNSQYICRIRCGT